MKLFHVELPMRLQLTPFLHQTIASFFLARDVAQAVHWGEVFMHAEQREHTQAHWEAAEASLVDLLRDARPSQEVLILNPDHVVLLESCLEQMINDMSITYQRRAVLSRLYTKLFT